MATLTPIDFDPFAETKKPKLTPVDHDPFAEPSTGGDVVKSLASGAAKGLVSLPGIVGDIQALARKAEPYLGIKTPEHPLIEVPTSSDLVEGAAKYAPGIKYEPQTDVGNVAHTVGEFVPGALAGGGGIARNLARYAVAPGLASEFLGQATKGTEYEPYARAAGGLAGAAVGNSLANLPGRTVSPILTRPELAPHVSLLEAEGIPLTAGQKTGSQALRWAEGMAADMPLASKSGADINAQQNEAITRALTKRMGYEQPNMGDAEWQAAKDRFSDPQTGLYPQLTSRNTLQMDPQFLQDTGGALGDYLRKVMPANRDKYITNVVKDLGDFRVSGGTIPGDTYQALRSDLEREATLADRSGKGRDAIAMRGLKDALDSAMSRSISPADAELWKQTNREYGAFKTLEAAAKGAGEQNARGFISPQRVRGEAAKRTASYLQGKNELGNIAQAAEAAMKPLPQSGTAPRNYWSKIFSTPTTGAAAGATLGGLPGAIGGAAAGAVLPTLAARALLSRPVQGWLGNNLAQNLGLVAQPTREQQIRGLVNALLASPIEANQPSAQ